MAQNLHNRPRVDRHSAPGLMARGFLRKLKENNDSPETGGFLNDQEQVLIDRTLDLLEQLVGRQHQPAPAKPPRARPVPPA